MNARLEFMLITASVALAREAEADGVERIVVDMESHGKAARQGHLDTHRAVHTLKDIAHVRAVLRIAELMVRINPPGPHTADEVDSALDAGAQRLMLPMFESVAQVREFLETVAGRVPVTFLFETPAALSCLPECLGPFASRDEVHFGLNDLSLAAGDRFLFEPWARGDLDLPFTACRTAHVPFGIGGVARVGRGELPAKWVIGEHVRVGSQRIILSRAFHKGGNINMAVEVRKLREIESAFRAAPDEALEVNHRRFTSRVTELSAR